MRCDKATFGWPIKPSVVMPNGVSLKSTAVDLPSHFKRMRWVIG